MTTGEITQEALLRDCEAQLDRVNEEAEELARGLTEAQLTWGPPDGGWSIAQVFAHLATANASYLDGIRSSIERDRASGSPPQHLSWKPSLIGGLLIRSLEPSAKRRMPTPKVWRPSVDQPHGSLDDFLQTQAAIASLVASAYGVDLMRARLSSPVSGMIRLNLGDAFRVLVVHDWRHIGQVRRILARDAFPRTAAA